jgi:hypothetical protein
MISETVDREYTQTFSNDCMIAFARSRGLEAPYVANPGLADSPWATRLAARAGACVGKLPNNAIL